MQAYVLGIESGLHACVMTAMDMDGHMLVRRTGRSTNPMTIGKKAAEVRLAAMADETLAAIGAERSGCRLVIVGAAGIDSPDSKRTAAELYASLRFICPVFCLNDGSVALYATTKGLGVMAISDLGSIAVGRNASGSITRSGGYPISIFGNEGSGQWIALSAMRQASRWLDGSMPETLLISKIDAYFKGLDANKMTECANALRRRPIDLRIAQLVYDAAQEGDQAAIDLLTDAARALFDVTETCVAKLGLADAPTFLSGVWGSVFTGSSVFFDEYRSLFQHKYPQSQVVYPESDTSGAAAQMALEYLDGGIPFINDLP